MKKCIQSETMTLEVWMLSKMKMLKLLDAREMITQEVDVQVDERDKCCGMGVQIVI
jgi:hypothetical protein